MAFEAAIAYLVALSLPVWLVAEQVSPWRRSSKEHPRSSVPGAVAADTSAVHASARRFVAELTRKHA